MYKLLRRVLNDNDDSCLSSASLLNVQTNQLDVHRLLLFKKAIICFWEQVGGIVRTKQWIFSATCTIDNVRIKPKLNTNNNLKAGSLQKYKQRRHVYSDKRKKKILLFVWTSLQRKMRKGLHVLEHLTRQALCCILNIKLILFCYSFYLIINIESVSTKRCHVVWSVIMNHIWFIMNFMYCTW